MSGFEVRTRIDLHDIQGNVIKGYGRFGFPVARYVFFQVCEQAAGRDFIQGLLPLITTSAPWTRYGTVGHGTAKPKVTTNVALTFEGLRWLGVPEQSLLSFPDEFVMGMRARTLILGDDKSSAPEHWDPIWQSGSRAQVVHVLVTINAATTDDIERRYSEILALVKASSGGVEQLTGHRTASGELGAYQDAAALKDENGNYTPKEHFGYTDGISDPYFKDSGSYPTYVVGGGKRVRNEPATDASGWAELDTGEFILGHVDEADEYPAAPIPTDLSKNGTFLVYRKLHENVESFRSYVSEEGEKFGDRDLFAAKLVGRWKSGAPLAMFPTAPEADAFMARLGAANRDRIDPAKSPAEQAAAKKLYYELKQQLSAFDFSADIAGGRCPVGAHTRRVNPRGSLEFGVDGAFDTPGALVNRRRIARRGLPYGESSAGSTDDGEHGIIFMVIGASIKRQFEFVQQQWVNYGNDFKLASDKDPILGNQGDEGGRMVFEGDPTGGPDGERPHFCTGIPRFVETRGGDYFFLPSLTALWGIAHGRIDPT